MNSRNRFYKPILVLLAILLLCGVSRTQRALNADRKILGFTKLEPLKNAPPMLAFTTVALGGFRGLIANMLWIRASELQEQEKFFEMVQLADWTTKLEPHYVQVWINNAWNMAFNISVKFANPEDRWRWVQRGIALLRDEGLKYNPDEALIYRELAWFYQFKLGYNLDDAHQYYKSNWFQEMHAVFNGKPNYAELFHPTSPESAQRLSTLTNKYKLDPKLMREIDEKYGPLEWRLPNAHAVYWAELGRRLAGPNDKVTVRRVIYQSMQQECLEGLVTDLGTNSAGEPIMRIGPNFDLVEKAKKTYEDMMVDETDKAYSEHMQIGHRNFLLQMIYMVYTDGRPKEAKKLFDYVDKTYPQYLAKYLRQGYTVDDYVLYALGVQLTETDHNKTTAAIKGLLYQSYLKLAMDEDDAAVTYEALAQKAWDYFQSKVPADQQKRIGLDSMQTFKKIALDEALAQMDSEAPAYAALIRSKLNLPAPAPKPAANASTNAAPTAAPK